MEDEKTWYCREHGVIVPNDKDCPVCLLDEREARKENMPHAVSSTVDSQTGPDGAAAKGQAEEAPFILSADGKTKLDMPNFRQLSPALRDLLEDPEWMRDAIDEGLPYWLRHIKKNVTKDLMVHGYPERVLDDQEVRKHLSKRITQWKGTAKKRVGQEAARRDKRRKQRELDLCAGRSWAGRTMATGTWRTAAEGAEEAAGGPGAGKGAGPIKSGAAVAVARPGSVNSCGEGILVSEMQPSWPTSGEEGDAQSQSYRDINAQGNIPAAAVVGFLHSNINQTRKLGDAEKRAAVAEAEKRSAVAEVKLEAEKRAAAAEAEKKVVVAKLEMKREFEKKQREFEKEQREQQAKITEKDLTILGLQKDAEIDRLKVTLSQQLAKKDDIQCLRGDLTNIQGEVNNMAGSIKEIRNSQKKAQRDQPSTFYPLFDDHDVDLTDHFDGESTRSPLLGESPLKDVSMGEGDSAIAAAALSPPATSGQGRDGPRRAPRYPPNANAVENIPYSKVLHDATVPPDDGVTTRLTDDDVELVAELLEGIELDQDGNIAEVASVSAGNQAQPPPATTDAARGGGKDIGRLRQSRDTSRRDQDGEEERVVEPRLTRSTRKKKNAAEDSAALLSTPSQNLRPRGNKASNAKTPATRKSARKKK